MGNPVEARRQKFWPIKLGVKAKPEVEIKITSWKEPGYCERRRWQWHKEVLSICLEKQVDPMGNQMERFVPLEFFDKKGMPLQVFRFSSVTGIIAKSLYHLLYQYAAILMGNKMELSFTLFPFCLPKSCTVSQQWKALNSTNKTGRWSRKRMDRKYKLSHWEALQDEVSQGSRSKQFYAEFFSYNFIASYL